jgi:FlaA1/EpsC-like NDP-sugar epimerase
MEMGLGRMVTISTDKAVNPVNVMGATKLLAERLTISANLYKGDEPTLFSCVRFGNVLDSRGSVIPIFREQIKKGGPLTLTHREMTRFVQSLSQAVELVLKATTTMEGGEIFILKMPRIRIFDLAEVMIDMYAPIYGVEKSKIGITYMGKREGEKMDEELITEEEAFQALETENMFVINNKFKSRRQEIDIHALKNSKTLSKSEIRDLLIETNK